MLQILDPLQPNYDRNFFLWDPGHSLRAIADHRSHVTDVRQRSLIDRVLVNLRSVPFDAVDRLLMIWETDRHSGATS